MTPRSNKGRIEDIEMTLYATRRFPAALLASSALVLLTACERPLDLDLRGRIGGAFDTSDAAQSATASRPKPDDRGIISYPNYQVAIARRGDTLQSVANRIGLPADELARHNGIQPGDSLRSGEVIALPRRVAEPSSATGTSAAGQISVTELAGAAIDSTPATPARPTASPASGQSGLEPIRHKVARGETAFTISRLYGVSVRALSEWNGLDGEFTIREGQYLLIPPVTQAPSSAASASSSQAIRTTEAPGTGSPTPTPPSASKPLPAETPAAASKPTPAPASPNLAAQTTQPTSNAKMSMPVDGSIIREYSKGKYEGIDISANPGTPVKAAASGKVAAITTDENNIPIVVVKHPDNLMTVYIRVDDISVSKGDNVSRGQSIGKIRSGNPSYVHFEVREGFESVDPTPYLR
ncbi:peptidoglycan DD-metalloendopeptidase family protein [Primorskyibacter flagellatus]|uniref:Murein DD-endopeptidase MepM and murein hydrolase activator NlpD, contain LysM domain n=1 Tax=Primorskyibacter flagellatus TaxID=1387277 RepID=A0A1W2BHW6_9RHOB|nr:Murein DD-endopeptidase MepM and murein hydrolase activator NlpD, contain LysM domain [Primorskyibacter flagellatus]